MQYVLKVRPQEGLSYARQLALALLAERLRFAGFFRSDHLRSIGQPGLPATEAWTTLAGLARETSTIRLGTLVTPVGLRLPYHLAKMVTTVDEMSGGRVELGLGAGWFEPEYTPLGVPFPTRRERFDRLEEQVEVIRRLWSEPSVTHSGRWYQLQDAELEPKPVQRPWPRIIVGTLAGDRGLRIAARFADEYNFDERSPDQVAEALPRLERACAEVGRDRGTLIVSAAILFPEGDATRRRAVVEAYRDLGMQRLYVDIRGDSVPEQAIVDFAREFIAPRG